MKKFKIIRKQIYELSAHISPPILNFKDEKVIFDDLKIIGIQSCQFTASNVELLFDDLPNLILNLIQLGWNKDPNNPEFFSKKNTRIRLRNIRLFGKNRIDLRIFSIN